MKFKYIEIIHLNLLHRALMEIVGGRIKIKTMQSPKISNILKNNSEVHPGGYWKPQDCYARDRIAIIIPFRDRQSHLNILLKYLHPFLQRQQIEYRIFVVEQVICVYLVTEPSLSRS